MADAYIDLLIIMGTSLVVQPFAGLANKVDFNVPRLLINKDNVGDPYIMLGAVVTSLMGLNPNFGSISNSHRDVFYKGDCDQECLELAAVL
jgi:NAD-dependent deacetylase sirtuin 2